MKIILHIIISLLSFNSFAIINTSTKPSEWKLNINLNFGTAYNLPTYLKIHQQGFEDIIIPWARYSTKGFKSPVYWDYKLELEKRNRFYGLRSTHHKLHLVNTTPEILHFNISHGYNLVVGYYGWKNKYYDLLIGAGIAFSHPEGIVNGQKVALEEGIPLIGGVYRLTAPNFEVEARKRFYIYKGIFFSSGIRFVAGYTNPKIQNGYVKTYPVGIHVAAGLGVDFLNKRSKNNKEDKN